MKNLIFLLGLPRSGTTLLQRVLSAHPEVASVTEPWVLLPLVTCFDTQITRSVYAHNILGIAIADLKAEAKNFQQEYDNHIRSFINAIYTPLRGNKKYFLDKTPRYYLIVDELHRIFPEAKFIYLFRNPIDIYDSIIETLLIGKLSDLPLHYLDVAQGVNILCESLGHNDKNSLKINYENFCSDSEGVVKKICNYLEIEYLPEILTNFSKVQFSGTLGDPKQGHLNKITSSCSNKPITAVRRCLYSQWLGNISESAWEASGYKHSELLVQLESRQRAGIRSQVKDIFGFTSFVKQRVLSSWSQQNLANRSKFGYFFL